MRPDTAPETERAGHAIAFSVRKSGTHLLREAIAAFGYTVYGGVAPATSRQPLVGSDVARRIVQLVYTPAEIETLTTDDAAALAVRQAIGAFLEAWWVRLGVRGPAPHIGPDVPAELVARILASPVTQDFADTPPGVCWFLHQLDPDRMDQSFIRPWAATGRPRLIYLYRDPRDVMLSMVNYLAGHSPDQLGTFGDLQVYAGILQSVPTLDERLTIALTDPCFPGASDFARGLWLLRHPQVLAVSFEDLVGPRGGGCAEAQAGTLARLAEFLGVATDLPAVARTLFNPAARTFHRGRIGGWKDHFSARHRKLFHDRHGAIAELYGYTT
jgi:hypothetical protein